MSEWLLQTWDELVSRGSGPLFFRLILQPLVAATFAIFAGLRDAREGKPAFSWAVLQEQDRAERRLLVRDAWKGVGRIFLIGWLLDVIYQLIVFSSIRPGQALIVAIALAIIPYLLSRGLTNRIVTLKMRMGSKSPD